MENKRKLPDLKIDKAVFEKSLKNDLPDMFKDMLNEKHIFHWGGLQTRKTYLQSLIKHLKRN